jgi:hypothetical protein
VWTYPILDGDRFQNTASLAAYAPPEATHGDGAALAANASKPALPIVGEGSGTDDDTEVLENISVEADANSEGEGDTVGDVSVEKVTCADEEGSVEEVTCTDEEGSADEVTCTDEEGSVEEITCTDEEGSADGVT